MENSLTYQAVGVDSEREGPVLSLLGRWVEQTFRLRPSHGAVKLPLGYFANVIDIGNGAGLALSTDGVGTKILIAQMLHKYDTIGIDCIAMNVNDVLCVGAEPLSVLDYIAVEALHPDLIEPIARGLHRGAELANVAIPGGELAQVREMIHGVRPGYGFDLVASCVGQVPLDRVLTGQDIREGDVIAGLRSSGIHSNGLTLARRIFFDRLGWAPDRHVKELGRSIGEELLEPTRIYVKEVLAMLRAGLRIKALAHITGGGFLNLSRASAAAGYVLDQLPEPQPIFRLIQRHGNVEDAEMFATYNMGIGFCVVIAPEDFGAAQQIARDHGVECRRIGFAVTDPGKKISIPAHGLTGEAGKFSAG